MQSGLGHGGAGDDDGNDGSGNDDDKRGGDKDEDYSNKSETDEDDTDEETDEDASDLEDGKKASNPDGDVRKTIRFKKKITDTVTLPSGKEIQVGCYTFFSALLTLIVFSRDSPSGQDCSKRQEADP